MKTRRWVAQVHPAGGGMPVEPVYFSDFEAVTAFVKEIKKFAPDDVVGVCAPAEATDQQRQELKEIGASLVDDKTGIGIDLKNIIKKRFEEAKRDFDELGGWMAFKSGEWLQLLIQRSFKNYWERGSAEYFSAKYSTRDKDQIADRLIKVAAKNAAILGGLTGAAISADEIAAIAGGGGVGLPANIAVAATAISAEVVLLMRFQLQMIANLGKLYGVPLDPEDPEDILTILAFAMGGGVAEAAAKVGMRIGGRAAGRGAKRIFSKQILGALKRIGAKIGVKILQRAIMRYMVPLVSIGIGSVWNYSATRTVGRFAIKHFKKQAASTE